MFVFMRHTKLLLTVLWETKSERRPSEHMFNILFRWKSRKILSLGEPTGKNIEEVYFKLCRSLIIQSVEEKQKYENKSQRLKLDLNW